MLLYFFFSFKNYGYACWSAGIPSNTHNQENQGRGYSENVLPLRSRMGSTCRRGETRKKFFWSVANNPACHMIDEKCTYIGMINISRENISSYIWDNYGCTNSNSCQLQFQFLAWNWLEFEMELTGIGIGAFLEIVIQHC